MEGGKLGGGRGCKLCKLGEVNWGGGGKLGGSMRL